LEGWDAEVTVTLLERVGLAERVGPAALEIAWCLRSGMAWKGGSVRPVLCNSEGCLVDGRFPAWWMGSRGHEMGPWSAGAPVQKLC
jgi:hypothetical protein